MKKSKRSSAFVCMIIAFVLASAMLLGCELELDDKGKRASTAGYNVTDLTISGQITSFEATQEFSFGSTAVITATYSNASKKTLSPSDVSVSFFSKTERADLPDFTKAKANDTVIVIMAHKSGNIRCEYQYEVAITNPVTSIKLKSVDVASVYNPGALSAALSTAFVYKVTATYADGTTKDDFASSCIFAVNADKTGIVASYKGRTVLTDELKNDDIKAAITSFEVTSGTKITGTGTWETNWAARTARVKIPSGKKYVAQMTVTDTGNINWLYDLLLVKGDDTTEYGVFRCDNYGWGSSYDAKGFKATFNYDFETVGKRPSDFAGYTLVTTIANNGDGTADVRYDWSKEGADSYYMEYKGITGITADDLYWAIIIDGTASVTFD